MLQKDRHSHLLNEELGDTLPASVLEKGDDPGMGVGTDAELASPVPIAEHVPLPLPRIAVSHSASTFECGSLPAALDRLSGIPGFGDDDVFTGSYDPTALSSPSAIETRPAVSGLKKKSLYTAVVTKHYCWASPPYGDIILKVILAILLNMFRFFCFVLFCLFFFCFFVVFFVLSYHPNY